MSEPVGLGDAFGVGGFHLGSFENQRLLLVRFANPDNELSGPPERGNALEI
jgi:hypothetical protein